MMKGATESASAKARLSVAFVLLPEFTLSTFSGFVDALRIAADEVDRSRQLHCRWTVLGPDRNAVRSSCGVEIAPWAPFSDPGEYDYTVVVGGLVRGHRKIDKRTLNYLRLVDERGGSLIGVCTGSFALARAGLMKGYRCCVHWHHLKEFTEEFPDHRVDGHSVFAIDGKRITCAGGQSAVDVAVHLVERHCGRSFALKVTSGMVLEAARGPKHPQPRPETKWFHEIRSGLVQRAILLMDQQSPAQRPPMEDIAARLGVSMRTLVRAFQSTFDLSPAVFMRALRLAHSRWEVLNTDKSLGWIASDFGFSDASHFTRLFRQYYGVTPQAARESGGAGARKPSRTLKPALRKILWGDPMSFAVIDWPSQEQESAVQ
jgi:transcriptional regulator GlxA family with amidase domain